jgi:hypothetical protein
MESPTELAALAERVEQIAIAIRQHIATNNASSLGAWNRDHSELLRRAAAVLRLNGGE